jgi:hypothetical protein
MPLEEILVKPSGEGVRKQVYGIHYPVKCLFPGVALDDQQQARPDEQFGVMLPNGSLVRLTVLDSTALKDDITITAGVVAAHYTTKVL